MSRLRKRGEFFFFFLGRSRRVPGKRLCVLTREVPRRKSTTPTEEQWTPSESPGAGTCPLRGATPAETRHPRSDLLPRLWTEGGSGRFPTDETVLPTRTAGRDVTLHRRSIDVCVRMVVRALKVYLCLDPGVPFDLPWLVTLSIVAINSGLGDRGELCLVPP